MHLKGFKQLPLREIDWRYPNNRTGENWRGKVIEKAGIVYRDVDTHQQMLVILFTDKTFLCVGMKDVNETGEDEHWEFSDKLIMKPSVYGDSLAKYHTYLDENDEIQFDLWVRMLIDMGFWKLSLEEAKAIHENHIKMNEDREYAEYLRLKKKFEGTDGK